MKPLTQKQTMLLSLLATDLSTREIGQILQITEHTVTGQVAPLLEQCGLTNRAQVADFLARRKEARAMITLDLIDYDTLVRIRNGDRAMAVRVPADLLSRGGIGVEGVRELVERIDLALRAVQEAK